MYIFGLKKKKTRGISLSLFQSLRRLWKGPLKRTIMRYMVKSFPDYNHHGAYQKEILHPFQTYRIIIPVDNTQGFSAFS